MAGTGIGSLRYAGGQDSGMRAARYAVKRRSQSKFLPAPVLGLNTMDPPELMKPGYATEIINWWPNENGLTTRGGSSPWNVGFNGFPVKTVMQWNSSTLFGVADSDIFSLYDTPQNDQEAQLSYTGLTESRLSWVNFSNDGGTFLCVCNGADAPIYYDGEEWTEAAFTLDSESFDASGFFAVTSHLSRLWWLKKDSQSVYYTATNAIQGAVTEFPVGAYLQRGGSLACFGALTQDGLTGSNDLFVIVSSEGEVLLYKGTNPDEASSWQLVGHGQIPRPVGAPRCICKLGPDLVVMTESGLVSINTAMSKEYPGLDATISDKIRSHWDNHLATYGAGEGYDLCVYHGRDLIMVNLPGPLGCTQLVVNPSTKAWGKIQGWENINCLCEYQGRLVGGGDTAVFILDYLYQDAVAGSKWIEGTGIWARDADDPDGSEWARDAEDADGATWTIFTAVPEPVHARVRHGYVALGGQVKKRFTLAKPYLISSSQPAAWFDLAEDFKEGDQLSEMFSKDDIAEGGEWYVSDWNRDAYDTSGADWMVGEGERQMRSRWMQAKGIGYFCAPIVAVDASTQHVTYTGCDVQYEAGNTI